MILVVFDRDGTINIDVEYLGRNQNWREEVQLHETVIPALKKLQNSKFKLAVASNQSGVARGYFTTEGVQEINQHMNELMQKEGVQIHGWFFSPYVDPALAQKEGFYSHNNPYIKATNCRKPGIGMLIQAAEKFGVKLDDFDKVFMIGDKCSDVETGLNAGGIGIIVLHGKNKELSKIEALKTQYPERVYIAENLNEAADIVLRMSS